MFAEQWENRYDEAFPMKKRILITGVDRTGTSACAALVHALTGQLIYDPAHHSKWNPHGYFEPVDFVKDTPASFPKFVQGHRDRPLYAVRNPRFCDTLDQFLDLLEHDEKPYLVYTWRRRDETQASWDRCGYGGPLHLDNLRECLQNQVMWAAQRGVVCARVLYHDLFDQKHLVIEHLCQKLELTPTDKQLALARQAVDPKLRHFDFRMEGE